MEVEVDHKHVHALSRLTSSSDWEIFIAYLSQIRESERDKLERDNTFDEINFIRGGIKRLKKILELRESVENALASSAIEEES